MKKLLALSNLVIFSGMIYLNFLGGTGALYGISTGMYLRFIQRSLLLPDLHFLFGVLFIFSILPLSFIK